MTMVQTAFMLVVVSLQGLAVTMRLTVCSYSKPGALWVDGDVDIDVELLLIAMEGARMVA